MGLLRLVDCSGRSGFLVAVGAAVWRRLFLRGDFGEDSELSDKDLIRFGCFLIGLLLLVGTNW